MLRIRGLIGEISVKMISTSTSYPTSFWISEPLFAEPLKKKKKMDPAVVKAREERKKKRIEKTIKKLEKNTKQLKPLEEIDLLVSLDKQKSLRNRMKEKPVIELDTLTLLKHWRLYKYQQNLSEIQMIDRITTSQSQALEQLKMISEKLYISAVEVDGTLVPFSAYGPKHTPPIQNYETQDGEYVDETPSWK